MHTKNATPKQLELIRELEQTGTFRVLRSIETPGPKPGKLRPDERLALIVDTETTGLDIYDDEIVEIGLILFAYDVNDNFTRVVGVFEGMREPENAMSDDAINITGITNDMLRGKKIDLGRLEEIVSRASLVIAHNAAFDRPMCEKLSLYSKKKHGLVPPLKFLGKAWAMTVRNSDTFFIKAAYFIRVIGLWKTVMRS